MKDGMAESGGLQKTPAPVRRVAQRMRSRFAVLPAVLGMETAMAMAMAILALTATPLQATAAPVDATTSPMPRTIAYRDLPARLCLPINAAAAADLESGHARLVLSIRHLRPIRRYGDPFTVRALAPEGAADAPLLTFALQPDIDAPGPKDGATGKPVPQSFLIDLTNRRIALHAREQLCLSLDLSRDPSPQPGAPTAEDRLEVGLTIRSVAP